MMKDDMKHTVAMIYQVPTANGNWSEPRQFETRDGNEWRRAVDAAHENGYKILKAWTKD